MDKNKKVNVKSTMNADVNLSYDPLRFKRQWTRKGTVLPVPFEVLEELMYDPGARYMFDQGILYIDDMEAKIALGLEPETAKEPTKIIVLNEGQMRKLLKLDSIEDFTDMVHKVSREQRIELVNFAVSLGEEINFDKADLLKKYTDIDVIVAIKNKRAADQAEKERKAAQEAAKAASGA